MIPLIHCNAGIEWGSSRADSQIHLSDTGQIIRVTTVECDGIDCHRLIGDDGSPATQRSKVRPIHKTAGSPVGDYIPIAWRGPRPFK